MALQVMALIAFLFGVGSLLLAAIVPNLSAWLVWNLLGVLIFSWPLWLIFTVGHGVNLDRELGWTVSAAMTVPSASCFVVCSGARGVWLARREGRFRLAWLIASVSFGLLACGIFLATSPVR